MIRTLLRSSVAATTLAFALACSGMGGSDVEGDWKFYPNDQELRFFKIIVKASKGVPLDKLEDDLGPLNAEERSLYNQVKANPNDPAVRGIVEITDQMKTSKVAITSDHFTISDKAGKAIVDETYEVTSTNGNVHNVKLASGETHAWTVDGDTIHAAVLTPVDYTFTLKRR